MKQRIITGIIVGAIAIFIEVMGGIFADAFMLVAAAIGLIEFYRAFRGKGYNPVDVAGYLTLLVFPLSFFADKEGAMSIMYNKTGDFNFYGLVFVVAIFTALAIMVLKYEKHNVIDVAITIFGMFYVTGLFSFLNLTRNSMNGAFIILIGVLCAVGSDTAALLVGINFGKHKLCPTISPKKTVEGCIGGLVGSVALAMILAAVFHITGCYTDMPIYHYPILGFVLGVAAQIGDLAASAIKRFTGIKDFGRILPGHGGILDRFDSYIAAVPITYLYIMLFIMPK